MRVFQLHKRTIYGENMCSPWQCNNKKINESSRYIIRTIDGFLIKSTWVHEIWINKTRSTGKMLATPSSNMRYNLDVQNGRQQLIREHQGDFTCQLVCKSLRSPMRDFLSTQLPHNTLWSRSSQKQQSVWWLIHTVTTYSHTEQTAHKIQQPRTHKLQLHNWQQFHVVIHKVQLYNYPTRLGNNLSVV